MRSRKVMRARLGYSELIEFLGGLVKGKPPFEIVNMPDDAKVVGVYPDPTRHAFDIHIESEKFQPVDEGCEIPRMTVWMGHVENVMEDDDDDEDDYEEPVEEKDPDYYLGDDQPGQDMRDYLNLHQELFNQAVRESHRKHQLDKSAREEPFWREFLGDDRYDEIAISGMISETKKALERLTLCGSEVEVTFCTGKVKFEELSEMPSDERIEHLIRSEISAGRLKVAPVICEFPGVTPDVPREPSPVKNAFGAQTIANCMCGLEGKHEPWCPKAHGTA